MTLPRKDLFDIPEGMIYLDGNSLGPLPKGVAAAVQDAVVAQWGGQLIKGWNSCGWMAQPAVVGDRVGHLIGASAGSVVMGDTLSIKVFQALAAGLAMRPDRKVILSDNGNFPSDLYMAEGLIDLKGQGYRLKVVDPEAVADAIDDSVAVVMLTEVDYRTGRKHDMQAITQAAHGAGAVMVWDLAHSAGALEVDLTAANCEFAVGCTYKYLNGGPGAPAFIYVRPDLADVVKPALAGWLGHAAPFAFDQTYTPGAGIERMRVGTPPVLQMAALEQALNVWDVTTMRDVRAASVALCDLFIQEVETRCPALTLISPRNGAQRGSQVSFAYDNGYPAMQALIARGVIGDFRALNVMRFGFTPLFIDAADVVQAATILQDILDNRLWDDPVYLTRSRVT
ncbi:kynureninase [Yoonia sediminilitoris]|uniref:Kynureninase n=1 Tax=Yoonia sediminilitoris TaxID=1286148 RepID=A0A2T6KFX4_9RHOB|nr:kynureninase [Yoonia sediminilitoris]PUB14227.1 kynureninase [Yoonia sediminilitoris]RCW95158.1 kynureninase [Yoonia sediminilitoris]